MQCTTNDWGYVLSSESQTLRQALTTSMSFYKYQSAIGGEKEREKLVFVYMVWCVAVVIFQSRLNIKIHVQVHFAVASQLYVHMNVEKEINAFLHLCLV